MGLVREADEKVERFDLLGKTWKVLYVINPSEAVGLLDLLEVFKLFEVRSDLKQNSDIGNRDILSDKEHSHLKMFVQVIDELFCLHSLSLFDEALDFESFFRVWLSEKDFIEVSALGNFHHNCQWERAAHWFLLILSTRFNEHRDF